MTVSTQPPQVHLPWSECPHDNGTAELECNKASATAYFWYREALDASPSIEQPGAPRWWIVLCLLLAWIVVFFIVMKGIQSSGKVRNLQNLQTVVVFTGKESGRDLGGKN